MGSQVPVACMEGKLWVRISAQYYNTLEDYQALADAVRDLVSEAESTNGDGGASHSSGNTHANGIS